MGERTRKGGKANYELPEYLASKERYGMRFLLSSTTEVLMGNDLHTMTMATIHTGTVSIH
jgi:hypothetical protein